MNHQIQFLINEKLPNKVRFKSCIKGDCDLYSINNCRNKECYLSGNYDIDGWRYDTIKNPIYDHQIIYTILNIALCIEHCDWYTLEPPDSLFLAIL